MRLFVGIEAGAFAFHFLSVVSIFWWALSYVWLLLQEERSSIKSRLVRVEDAIPSIHLLDLTVTVAHGN